MNYRLPLYSQQMTIATWRCCLCGRQTSARLLSEARGVLSFHAYYVCAPKTSFTSSYRIQCRLIKLCHNGTHLFINMKLL